MEVRTRFAPSPTGYLHVGAARTALYAFLFARKTCGKFILRIEDTDLIRSNKKSVNSIINGMKWLNLNWDEGPYFQSQRLDRYLKIINQMLTEGSAYKCFCSQDRLDKLRNLQLQNGKKPKYDGYCRNNFKINALNKFYSVRFKNPQNGYIIFKDQIYGLIKFDNRELDDLIILRSNGLPTYNFCVVIDDFDMKITHVIRGEDHINNTPRQINIMQALNIKIPKYAHLPMILNNNGKKLSKRCDIIDVIYYRNNGFLADAMLNHLLRLGWSHKNQEIFDLKTMKQLFNLNNINKSSSIFDIKKLLWFNRYYINHLSTEYISTQLIWYIKKENINTDHGPKLLDIVKLFKRRFNTLKEIALLCKYFYQNFDIFNNDVIKKYLKLDSLQYLGIIRQKLALLKQWTPVHIYKEIKQTSDETKIDIKKICISLRIVMIGTDQSPEISKIIFIIGKINSLIRIDKALIYINSLK